MFFLFGGDSRTSTGARIAFHRRAHGEPALSPPWRYLLSQTGESPLSAYSEINFSAFACLESGSILSHTNKKGTPSGAFLFGGDKWTRTTDPLHVKQVL